MEDILWYFVSHKPSYFSFMINDSTYCLVELLSERFEWQTSITKQVIFWDTQKWFQGFLNEQWSCYGISLQVIFNTDQMSIIKVIIYWFYSLSLFKSNTIGGFVGKPFFTRNAALMKVVIPLLLTPWPPCTCP